MLHAFFQLGVETAQLFLHPLHLADVAGGGVDTEHIALGIAIGAGVVEHRHQRAGDMAQGEGVIPHRAPLESVLIALPGPLRFGEKIGEVSSLQRPSRQPGGLDRRLIDILDRAAGADRDQGIDAGFNQAAGVVHLLQQRLLLSLEGGDVEHDRDQLQ